MNLSRRRFIHLGGCAALTASGMVSSYLDLSLMNAGRLGGCQRLQGARLRLPLWGERRQQSPDSGRRRAVQPLREASRWHRNTSHVRARVGWRRLRRHVVRTPSIDAGASYAIQSGNGRHLAERRNARRADDNRSVQFGIGRSTATVVFAFRPSDSVADVALG